MSATHELIDRKNKRRFGLDKGNWYAAGFHRSESMTVEEVRLGCHVARPDIESWDDVPESIWAFCDVAGWDIELYNDIGNYSDEAMKNWPMVDDRCAWDTDDLDPDPCEDQTQSALVRAHGKVTP